MRSIKKKATSKWLGIENALQNFSLLIFFYLGRPPMRISPPEKSLYFLIGKVTHYNDINVEKKNH